MQKEQWQKILGKNFRDPLARMYFPLSASNLCIMLCIQLHFTKTSHLSQADFLGIIAVFEHNFENLDFFTVKDVSLVEFLRGGLNIYSLQIAHTKPGHFNLIFLNICKIVMDKPTCEEGKFNFRNVQNKYIAKRERSVMWLLTPTAPTSWV